MLVLSGHKNESVMIGNDIKLTVVDIRGDKVRLGIAAPQDVPVHRLEVFDAIRLENAGAIISPDRSRNTEEQLTEMARDRGLLLNGEALRQIEALSQLFETMIACGRQKVAVGE